MTTADVSPDRSHPELGEPLGLPDTVPPGFVRFAHAVFGPTIPRVETLSMRGPAPDAARPRSVAAAPRSDLPPDRPGVRRRVRRRGRGPDRVQREGLVHRRPGDVVGRRSPSTLVAGGRPVGQRVPVARVGDAPGVVAPPRGAAPGGRRADASSDRSRGRHTDHMATRSDDRAAVAPRGAPAPGRGRPADPVARRARPVAGVRPDGLVQLDRRGLGRPSAAVAQLAESRTWQPGADVDAVLERHAAA